MITVDAKRSTARLLDDEWEITLDCGVTITAPFIVADTKAFYLDVESPLCRDCEDCPIKEYMNGIQDES